MRYLLLLVLVAVGVFLWRSSRSPTPPVSEMKEQERLPEGMVACRVCGVFVPESEAFRAASGAVYCCEAHREQDAA